MAISDSPIVKYFTDAIGMVVKFFDNAYKQGWLVYLIIGLVIFMVYVMFF